jgi:hypothetical protein
VTLTIRPATPDDAGPAGDLLAQLGHPGNTADDLRRRLALWSTERYGIVLAADLDGETVGRFLKELEPGALGNSYAEGHAVEA